jgi:amidase
VTSSATPLARAIQARQGSALEVVEAHLQRIADVNPRLNAVVQLPAEAARAQAHAADAALARGEIHGPLHGVPVTIKDAFDTAGIISTAGTLGRAGFIPRQDATAVARLRAAGAIVLGKTNLPELSMACESHNLIYGRTNNPYDLARTPGGSSGGEAAIIAACGSPLGLGTDAGGSLRVPSHFCDIATIKPTRGRVPMIGAGGALWHAGPDRETRGGPDPDAAHPCRAGLAGCAGGGDAAGRSRGTGSSSPSRRILHRQRHHAGDA